MVIGNGLLATTFSSFKNNQKVVIFASGVSNSLEENKSEFERELALLKKSYKNYPNSTLVYFSTLSILDDEVNKRPYVQHKIAMESFICKNIPNYLILRVSNVVGSNGNSHTIVNYLVNAVKNKIPITIWESAERNLIAVDDVKFIVTELLKKEERNKIVNIATNYNIPVIKILQTIEAYFNKKAIVKLLPLGNKLAIDVSYIALYLNEIEKKKGTGINYIKTLLKSYY